MTLPSPWPILEECLDGGVPNEVHGMDFLCPDLSIEISQASFPPQHTDGIDLQKGTDAPLLACNVTHHVDWPADSRKSSLSEISWRCKARQRNVSSSTRTTNMLQISQPLSSLIWPGLTSWDSRMRDAMPLEGESSTGATLHSMIHQEALHFCSCCISPGAA